MPKSYSVCFFGKLYDRMADDLHLAGMSERTHAGYLRAVRQLADYCKTPPAKVSEEQLRRYFLHLKMGDVGQIEAAEHQRTVRDAHRPTSPPDHRRLHHRPRAVYFWTVYSLRLRMQKGLNLHVGDIDSQRMMVHVHRGKGAKDRSYAEDRKIGWFQ